MSQLRVAAVQMACSGEREHNLEKARALVVEAHRRGARLVLLPELFQSLYFCQEDDPVHLALAETLDESGVVAFGRALAAELEVVLPVSFFERDGDDYFNSLAIVERDGSVAGCYRKSHIPDGPGYREKSYFTPGATGFQVHDLSVGRIGVAICWDQWFPECARSLTLQEAELVVYPTAIGSEPEEPDLDTQPIWRRVMQGHAAANCLPVVAANRVGNEVFGDSFIDFYGSSFVTDEHGAVLVEADRSEETVIVADLDLERVSEARSSWGFLRDRRPSLYGDLVAPLTESADESK